MWILNYYLGRSAQHMPEGDAQQLSHESKEEIILLFIVCLS